MRIFCCRFYDPNEGAVLSWHRHRAEAQKDLQRLQGERLRAGDSASGPEGVEEFIIEGTADGLCRWLNRHFTRDNG